MDQIIIEHYKNSCNFLSLNFLRIPFTVDNGLYINEEQVYKNELEEEISINKEKEGFWICWYEDRSKYSEQTYKNGKKEGYYISWYVNGQLNARNSHVSIKQSEGNWKDEKQDGLWTFWYKNGNKKLKGNWKNGKQDGFWISWYENGKKLLEGNYKYGKLEDFVFFGMKMES